MSLEKREWTGREPAGRATAPRKSSLNDRQCLPQGCSLRDSLAFGNSACSFSLSPRGSFGSEERLRRSSVIQEEWQPAGQEVRRKMQCFQADQSHSLGPALLLLAIKSLGECTSGYAVGTVTIQQLTTSHSHFERECSQCETVARVWLESSSSMFTKPLVRA